MPAYIQGNLALKHYPTYESAHTEPSSKTSPRKNLRKKDKIRYLLFVAIIIGIAMFISFRYAQIYQMDASIYRMQKEIRQTLIENQQLSQEVEKLQSPERLKEEAAKLGFVPRVNFQVAQITDYLQESITVATNP